MEIKCLSQTVWKSVKYMYKIHLFEIVKTYFRTPKKNWKKKDNDIQN